MYRFRIFMGSGGIVRLLIYREIVKGEFRSFLRSRIEVR